MVSDYGSTEKKTSLYSAVSTHTYESQDEDLESLHRLKTRLIKIREDNNCVRVAMQDRDIPLEIPPNVVAEIKILEYQLKAKKSKMRVKQMREFQDELRNAFFKLKKSPHEQSSINEFRTDIQMIKSKISEPYENGQAFLREKEGMIQVRPYLNRQLDKLEALKNGHRPTLEGLLKGEDELHDNLQHLNNPLPPLEKAVLVSLSRILDQMIELSLQGIEKRGLSKITVKKFTGSPSLSPTNANFDIFDAHTRLFSLRSKLRLAKDSDKAKLEAEIKDLDSLIKAHRKK